MCSVGEQIAKLCRMAGELEYEVSRKIGNDLYYDYGNLRVAQSLLTAQGDPWALDVFDRLTAKLAESEKEQSVLAKLQSGRSPSDTVQDALDRAKEVLHCDDLGVRKPRLG